MAWWNWNDVTIENIKQICCFSFIYLTRIGVRPRPGRAPRYVKSSDQGKHTTEQLKIAKEKNRMATKI